MTNTFAAIARDLIAQNGFTPCVHSSFETDDMACAFSVEFTDGTSASSPCVGVTIYKATGRTFVTNSKTHQHLDFFSVES